VEDTLLDQKILKMVLSHAETAENYQNDCFDIAEDGSKKKKRSDY